MPEPTPQAALEAFRAGFASKPLNARDLAALADNPRCNSRRVFDAAAVDKSAIAKRLGQEVPEGQSVFALQRGNRFERDVKANGYAMLIELLAAAGFEPEAAEVLPLRDLFPINRKDPDFALAKRAEATRNAVLAMARGEEGAATVIDGGALVWDYGGAVARLEADGIAWRIGGRLHVIEIKSFPIVDNRADPVKVGAAARQSAVYVAALRDLLRDAGLNPEFVSAQVLLVCPKNTSLRGTVKVLDVRSQLRTLRRILSTWTSIPVLLSRLDPEMNLEIDGLAERQAAERLATVMERLGTNYTPSCLSSCALAFHCRERARAAALAGVLGPEVRNGIGEVPDLRRAVELAQGAPPSTDEEDSAALLRRAADLLEEAGLPAMPEPLELEEVA